MLSDTLQGQLVLLFRFGPLIRSRMAPAKIRHFLFLKFQLAVELYHFVDFFLAVSEVRDEIIEAITEFENELVYVCIRVFVVKIFLSVLTEQVKSVFMEESAAKDLFMRSETVMNTSLQNIINFLK